VLICEGRVGGRVDRVMATDDCSNIADRMGVVIYRESTVGRKPFGRGSIIWKEESPRE
jgi:hypothetical protein